jgi:hypothetical protein
MKEYADSDLARRGHKAVVELMEKGGLKLISQDRSGQ